LLVAPPTTTCPAQRCFAKRIVYAERRLVASDLTRSVRHEVSFDPPDVADIPQPGQVIDSGQPICTVYGMGESL
jgi:predicted ATP-grasp superfamily ATP-dependent carboligase